MLRIYFLQHWFDLLDSAAEDAIYDASSARGDSPRQTYADAEAWLLSIGSAGQKDESSAG